ncbi:hypothetical protein fugu_019461 [Takifugu bimaculatus]|uniref:Proteasome subunit beta n=1 Tax=Takifugu bimaculatus TaxID=433685 RepID=A0A4Z2BKE2_9TELE|nr:hypothetical protein fugu_019461 [Takifugu bimaculatus]
MFHSLKACELQNGGFCFENSHRNAVLESNFSEYGYKAPNARKTGTTIAGMVYKDGVILGADTRATDDMVVADKNCIKIHYIAPKIYCCGAGVAADAEVTTQIMASNVELHMLNTGRPPLVATVTRQLKQMLFRYQGHVGSSLIIGGTDVTGAHLYSVYPHGSYDKLPYLTMGSGAAAAISVLEDRYKPNMELEEAKNLMRDTIAAGIFTDLGSGSNCGPVHYHTSWGGVSARLRPAHSQSKENGSVQVQARHHGCPHQNCNPPVCGHGQRVCPGHGHRIKHTVFLMSKKLEHKGTCVKTSFHC